MSFFRPQRRSVDHAGSSHFLPLHEQLSAAERRRLFQKKSRRVDDDDDDDEGLATSMISFQVSEHNNSSEHIVEMRQYVREQSE